MQDVGMVEVTANGATGVAFNWQDPGTINASTPTQIELEWAPDEWSCIGKTSGGTPGAFIVSVTATGGTFTGTAGDTSKYRITGKVYSNGRPPR